MKKSLLFISGILTGVLFGTIALIYPFFNKIEYLKTLNYGDMRREEVIYHLFSLMKKAPLLYYYYGILITGVVISLINIYLLMKEK